MPTYQDENPRILTVTEALTEVRESLCLSRSDVAKKIKIPKRYIDYFEGEHVSKMIFDIYARHKLKAYCDFLNLDTDKVIREFQAMQTLQTTVAKNNPTLAQPRITSEWRKHPLKNIPAVTMLITPKIIRGALVACAIIGLGLFIFSRTYRMSAPPTITVTTPTEGMVTYEKTLTVKGKTEKEVILLVNGKPVNIDETGNFKDDLDLREGLNTIRIVAIRRHGQETEVMRRVIVRPTERPTAIYGPAR